MNRSVEMLEFLGGLFGGLFGGTKSYWTVMVDVGSYLDEETADGSKSSVIKAMQQVFRKYHLGMYANKIVSSELNTKYTSHVEVPVRDEHEAQTLATHLIEIAQYPNSDASPDANTRHVALVTEYDKNPSAGGVVKSQWDAATRRKVIA